MQKKSAILCHERTLPQDEKAVVTVLHGTDGHVCISFGYSHVWNWKCIPYTDKLSLEFMQSLDLGRIKSSLNPILLNYGRFTSSIRWYSLGHGILLETLHLDE
jgi:hypothetical protein